MENILKIFISIIILYGLIHFFILGAHKSKVINDTKDSFYSVGTEFTPPIFSLGFIDGHIHKDDNGNVYKMHPLYIGNLALTSGKIVVGEPYYFFDIEPLDIALKIGTYPVYLAEVIIKKKNLVVDKRNALVKVKLASSPAVTWKYKASFSVDGGTGGYFDYQNLKEIISNQNFDNFIDSVMKEFGTTYTIPKPFHEKHHLYHQYKNISYKDSNIIIFSAGWGDGVYNSYIGYDSEGNVVEILTDLGVIWWDPKVYSRS